MVHSFFQLESGYFFSTHPVSEKSNRYKQVLRHNIAIITFYHSQVSYNATQGGTVSFTVKAGKVFGSYRSDSDYYNLEPCLGVKHCHLWMKIKKKTTS